MGMFGQLVEEIRTVVEGEGHVDKYDTYARRWDRVKRSSTVGSKSRAKSGSGRILKRLASRLARREARRKIRMGRESEIRPSVIKGYSS